MFALFNNWVRGDIVLFFWFAMFGVLFMAFAALASLPRIGRIALAIFGGLWVGGLYLLTVWDVSDRSGKIDTIAQQVTSVFGGTDFKGMTVDASQDSARITLPDGCSFKVEFHEWRSGILVAVSDLTSSSHNQTTALSAAVSPAEARNFVLENCFPN